MIEDPPVLTISRNFTRPDKNLVSQLSGAQTGMIVDCMDGSGGLHHSIKPVTPKTTSFVGVAVTCAAGPADNLAVFGAIDLCQPGDAIMISTEAHTGCAVIGDLVVGMSANLGAVGMVTDGGVRDVVGICEERRARVDSKSRGMAPR